jgi:uncharacterized protein (DUF433 family)
MNYDHLFVREPNICGGETTVVGTRVTVRTILASLAEGATIEEILLDFPSLTTADIQAVISFAAASTVDDIPLPPIPDYA